MKQNHKITTIHVALKAILLACALKWKYVKVCAMAWHLNVNDEPTVRELNTEVNKFRIKFLLQLIVFTAEGKVNELFSIFIFWIQSVYCKIWEIEYPTNLAWYRRHKMVSGRVKQCFNRMVGEDSFEGSITQRLPSCVPTTTRSSPAAKMQTPLPSFNIVPWTTQVLNHGRVLDCCNVMSTVHTLWGVPDKFKHATTRIT